MDQESDDESECNVETSFQQDVSFTSHTGDLFIHSAEEKKDDDDDDDDNKQGNEILSSMSSLDDLKFLISTLKSEKANQFRGRGIWTVVPRNSWDMARRSAFVNWLTECLQFDVSSLGNGLIVLKISKSSGEELLGRLTLSLQEYQDGPTISVPPSPVLIASSIDTTKAGRLSRSQKPASAPSLECSLAFDLTSNLEKLTVEDKPDQPPQQLVLGAPRASFGSSRSSFDRSVCEPGDLHLPGHETPMPRSSQMCISSTEHTVTSRGRNSSISVPMSVAPMQNLEFVETYVWLCCVAVFLISSFW